MQTLGITDYIRHGSLDVPRSCETQYEAAKAYLRHDPVERRLFDRLEHARNRHYCLHINNKNEDYFDPNTDTIGWDPYSALRTTRGGTQSPALGLGHEVDHAVENPAAEQHFMNRFDRVFDNKEERRVILGSEKHAARTLGESPRHDHSGDTYRVPNPTAR